MGMLAVRQSMWLFLASTSLIVLLVTHPMNGVEGKVVLANVHLCMMNCGQCKEMYGEYFDGQRCAEFCLASYKGSAGPSASWPSMPDCNEPDTVDQFLKKELESREWIGFNNNNNNKPVSQALISPYGVGRRQVQQVGQQQQNTMYNSRTGSEFKGPIAGSWKKRINGKLGSSMPRWYFL